MRADLRWARCLSTFLLLLVFGCGTPGLPRPPSLNLAKPVSDLKGTRSENHVILSWTVPTETTDGAAFRHRGASKICRSIDQLPANRCSLVGTVQTPEGSKSMSFSDTLPTDSTGPNDYVAYAIEVDNDRGRSAGLSHPVEIPAAATSTLHGTPSAELTPDSVIVTAHVTQQNPAVAQTLELRRQQKGATEEETTVAQRPLEVGSPGESSNLELRDDSLVWEKKYQYRVVVVGVAKIPENGNVTFAGSISPEIEIATHDVFPPNVPTGIQAVFSGSFAGQQSSIDLTWNPNLDRDLRGYFIYRRRQDEPAPLATKLNTQPVTTPAYRDTAVQSGNTYVYSVSAVDERGNESKRSEEASEQVPK